MQVAQSVHAAFQFAREHPRETAEWLSASQTLVVLAVPDEAALLDYALHHGGTARTLVREPDLDDEATALACGPSHWNVAFSSLPLAGKAPAMVT